MHHQITPGAVVQTADQIELRVRALEGNVAELEAFDGSFVGFRHVSSLTLVSPQAREPECLPPAIQTAPAFGLAAAAGAGQGAGTRRRAYRPAVVAVTRHDEAVDRLRASNLAAFSAHAAYLAAESRR